MFALQSRQRAFTVLMLYASLQSALAVEKPHIFFLLIDVLILIHSSPSDCAEKLLLALTVSRWCP